MVDDYSISGVNDSCTIHTKLDLHMLDTFVAVVKLYFESMKQQSGDCTLAAKTCDLKSAYRQIPVKASHRKYAYFCIYNHEVGGVEIYRSMTLPFGTNLLHCIACRGPRLMTTNFYDDFILASHPGLQDSAKSSMELVFLFTGWEFAVEGRKATDFSSVCAALGVEFNLKGSLDGVLEIQNTQSRVAA